MTARTEMIINQQFNSKNFANMSKTFKRRNFTSWDVSASTLARSINGELKVSHIRFEDVILTGDRLGFNTHVNKYGTRCYTSVEAEDIRDTMISEYRDEEARDKLKAWTPETPEKSDLSSFPIQDLVFELRSRGCTVECYTTQRIDY